MRQKEIYLERLMPPNEVLPECMPEFIQRHNLHAYFKEIKNHETYMPNTNYEIPERVFWVFPVSLGIAVNPVYTLDYMIADSIMHAFFDCAWYLKEDASEKLDAIEIRVNGIVAGYYILEKESFILSDWTHNSATVKIADYVFTKLMNDLHITPIRSDTDNRPKFFIKLGADPEFEVLNDLNEIVSASQYLHCHHLSTETPIGVDGCDRIVEFRPEPASTPEDIVCNIAELMSQFYSEYRTDLSAEGDTYAIGSHIHVSISDTEDGPPHVLRITDGLVNLFADFLGRPFRTFNGKARGGYDQLDAFRTNEHGFEYRALPAGVLTNPRMALYVFKITKGLMEFYLNNIGARVRYNSNPGVNEYVKMVGLSPEEYYEFVNLIRDGWRYDRYNIIGAWIGENVKEKIKNAPTSFRPIIWFKDEWLSIIKNYMMERLIKRMTEEKIIMPLVLFGISGDRGNVCTIDVTHPGANTITKIDLTNFPQYANDLANKRSIPVGISRNIRMYTMEGDIEFIDLNFLVEDIINYAKSVGGQ